MLETLERSIDISNGTGGFRSFLLLSIVFSGFEHSHQIALLSSWLAMEITHFESLWCENGDFPLPRCRCPSWRWAITRAKFHRDIDSPWFTNRTQGFKWISQHFQVPNYQTRNIFAPFCASYQHRSLAGLAETAGGNRSTKSDLPRGWLAGRTYTVHQYSYREIVIS